MADTYAASINVSIVPSIVGNLGTLSGTLSRTLALTSGVSDNQFDQAFLDERTVTAGTPDDIYLFSGGLKDLAQTLFQPVEIVAIGINNLSTTTGQILTWGNTAANTFTGPLKGTLPGIDIYPSGPFCIAAPLAAAWAVTSATERMRIQSASGTISYVICILGRTA